MPAVLLFIIGLLATLAAGPVHAHGSVTADDDLCLIQIGYLRAHFKVYLPRQREHQDFCEDLPAAGEALFVMEYQHGELGRLPLDFRIIRNTTGMGRFATLEDLEKIANLDAITVFRDQSLSPDVYTALHRFEEEGEYLGIVRATDPRSGRVYSAVFPFAVGYTKVGYLPLFLLLAISAHWLFRYLNRRFQAATGEEFDE